jgi:hypothetical protein
VTTEIVRLLAFILNEDLTTALQYFILAGFCYVTRKRDLESLHRKATVTRKRLVNFSVGGRETILQIHRYSGVNSVF